MIFTVNSIVFIYKPSIYKCSFFVNENTLYRKKTDLPNSQFSMAEGLPGRGNGNLVAGAFEVKAAEDIEAGGMET